MPRVHCSALSVRLPFLYPRGFVRANRHHARNRRAVSTAAEESRLNPAPDDYSVFPFTDKCNVTLAPGAGGNGCVSFLREKFIESGPANGGDGGSGGHIYIQAVRGETSLFKLSKQTLIRAGRGANGQGKSRGGEKGKDVLFEVPVGTVVREVWRTDPIAEEEERLQLLRRSGSKEALGQHRKDKWILFPGTLPRSWSTAEMPAAPPARRHHLAASEPSGPIRLDLDEPMEKPMLLVAGAVGGLGNPNFVSKDQPWPKYATKGEMPSRLHLQMELKIMADVGLVGLPNAGKSTLLRSLSNSRTRVGNWAFTTLQPNIGTVVLDDHSGHPRMRCFRKTGEPRMNFTIADIPGLIEDAHLDKGLGHGFLRHVERAAVLAFVIDLSAGDAVTALQALWKEVAEYEAFRTAEMAMDTQKPVKWQPAISFESPKDPRDFLGQDSKALPSGWTLPPLELPPMTAKPWMVIGTKADLPETQENFEALQAYLEGVSDGTVEHPARRKNAWRKGVKGLPVSGIKGEGVEKIVSEVVQLLDD